MKFSSVCSVKFSLEVQSNYLRDSVSLYLPSYYGNKNRTAISNSSCLKDTFKCLADATTFTCYVTYTCVYCARRSLAVAPLIIIKARLWFIVARLNISSMRVIILSARLKLYARVFAIALIINARYVDKKLTLRTLFINVSYIYFHM